MVIKILVYIGLFLVIRNLIRKAFFTEKIVNPPKKSPSDGDVFEASYKVVDKEQ